MLNQTLTSIALAIPDPGTGTQPPGFEKFTTIMGWGKWMAFGILVMSLVFAGVKMAIGNRQGDGGQHAASIGWVLGGVMVVSGAFAIVGALAT
jgi:hypothetical protein